MVGLEKNPSVCFEVDEYFGIVSRDSPCRCGIACRSVITFGTAEIPTDSEEKTPPLRIILAKYVGEEMAQGLATEMMENCCSSSGRQTAVVRIRIQSFTGKRADIDENRFAEGGLSRPLP